MKAYKFGHLLWEFNALLDTGRFDDITVAEVSKHIEAGTIASFLTDRFSGEADFSLMEPADWNDLGEEWQGFDNAIDAKRKMGIEKRGLCLLLGFALQSYMNRKRKDQK